MGLHASRTTLHLEGVDTPVALNCTTRPRPCYSIGRGGELEQRAGRSWSTLPPPSAHLCGALHSHARLIRTRVLPSCMVYSAELPPPPPSTPCTSSGSACTSSAHRAVVHDGRRFEEEVKDNAGGRPWEYLDRRSRRQPRCVGTSSRKSVGRHVRYRLRRPCPGSGRPGSRQI